MTGLAFPKPLPRVPKKKGQRPTERAQEKDRALEAWKVTVKRRVGNVCEMAGIAGVQCRGPMDAAHVIGRGRCPRLKLDLENGVCLCRAHHDAYDRTRWFKPHFNAWMDSKYPGRRERLLRKAQREARVNE